MYGTVLSPRSVWLKCTIPDVTPDVHFAGYNDIMFIPVSVIVIFPSLNHMDFWNSNSLH